VQNAQPPAAKNLQPQPAPSPTVQRAAPSANPAAVPPPTQAISKQQFMMPKGQAPTANISQLKQQRQEVREGNRVIIREPDRTIIEQGNRTIVRHNEVDRFAVDARNVHVDRQGNETVTIVERPDGVRIINITDDRGNLIRRVRRDPSGREIIIIDNTFAGAQRDDVFIEVSPPILRIPRERYIVEAGIANGAAIYDVFIAPPIERIDRRYTVEQVRYSEPLRARMPRVDLDVNFDTGSWQLTPDQVDKLAVVADGLNRAISRNSQEVFLIEGHTDAVGSDIDNLSLSDRRAESVAVALTEQFQVPAENLVTQGYGKQDLKIQTEGPERANRRVAIRRITPLIAQQATIAPR
jgi:outer membrane protein OmpA-like peptidoglycan-associated protein